MKKMISLLITILLSISMVTGCAVSAGVDKTAAKMEKAQLEAESAQLYIDIEFQENLFFDKYDVELYLDDNRLTTMPHGQNYTELVQTTVGDHVIKFINETDDSVKTTKNITVKGDMTFQCEIRTHDDEIEIVDIDLIDSVEGASLRVDNYIGTVLSVAEDKLEESGFANVKSESDGDGSIWDSDNWVVMEQSVVPGTEMDKNDPIILTCRKTETYLNENYGGLNIPEAREKADELGHILLYKNHLTEEDLGVRVEQMDEDELSLWSVREVDKSLYEEKKAVLELIYTGEREVPDVTGISLRDAFSKLYAADFSNVEEKAASGAEDTFNAVLVNYRIYIKDNYARTDYIYRYDGSFWVPRFYERAKLAGAEAANRKISVDTSSSPMTEATMTEFCKDPQGVLNQKALDSIKSDLEGTTGHPTITYYSKIQYVWG